MRYQYFTSRLQHHENSPETKNLWRLSLLPLGCEAALLLSGAWGRYAAQREQAPSPQVFGVRAIFVVLKARCKILIMHNLIH